MATSSADHDDALQELHRLVNGRISVKSCAGGGKFVMQDGLQLFSQAVCFLLQLGLLLLCGQSVLLQLLVVPVTQLSVTEIWLSLTELWLLVTQMWLFVTQVWLLVTHMWLFVTQMWLCWTQHVNADFARALPGHCQGIARAGAPLRTCYQIWHLLLGRIVVAEHVLWNRYYTTAVSQLAMWSRCHACCMIAPMTALLTGRRGVQAWWELYG